MSRMAPDELRRLLQVAREAGNLHVARQIEEALVDSSEPIRRGRLTLEERGDRGMREKDLDEKVKRLCKEFGWLRYHTYRAERSPAGFPDLVLVRGERLIFAELKTQLGQLRPEQEAWLGALRIVANIGALDALSGEAGIEVYLWRPSDLRLGLIEEALA